MKKTHKNLIIIGSIIGTIAFTLGVLNIIPPKKVLDGNSNPFIIQEGARPMISAHRGGGNLNPENTFKAIDYSFDNFHVDIIEIDVCLTKDDHLILNHNMTIDSSTEESIVDGEYYVREHNLNEIQTKNFGYNFQDKKGDFIYRNILDGVPEYNVYDVLKENKLSVVTIDELFNKYSNKDLKYIIEIKDKQEDGIKAADILIEKMKKYQMVNKVIIGTYHSEVEKHIIENYKEVMVGASLSSATGFFATQLLGVNIFYKTSVTALQVPVEYNLKGINFNLARKNYINRAHRRNISVQYWTINDKEKMRMLIELGADVITTDNPDIMYELLNEMGY
jgi:glycerophosphoryl diester phosphodiesterase